MSKLCSLLTLSASLLMNTGAQALTYTFNSGTEGFTAVDFPSGAHSTTPGRQPAAFDSSIGNPAGSLREPDLYYDTGVATPLTYVGNLNSAYGSTISYDLLARYIDTVPYKAITINCTTDTLYWMSAEPTVNVWNTKSVQLTESNWSRTSTSTVASRAQFCQLLTTAKGIYFLTEWHSGADDTNADNITIPAICRSGDANRDGAVNFADLLIVAQHYGTSPAGTPDVTWALGDFDGSNTVVFADLLALAQNYGATALTDPGVGESSFRADWSLARSMVPEPTALAGVIALAHRRRRW